MKPDKAPTKHQLRSEATRSALLKAAEVIFARDGYESAQIDEIAQESGRTRGAVYAQFKTKEQMFFAVQEHRVEKAASDVWAILEDIPEGNHHARLLALRGYFASVQDATGSILDLEFKLFALRHADSVEKWRQNYLRLFPNAEFHRVFGVKERRGRARLVNRVSALAAVKGGLVLAMMFLPDQLTEKETTSLLTDIFDGLFPEVLEGQAEQGDKKKQTSRTPKGK